MKLSDRVEKLTGPDRAMDLEIELCLEDGHYTYPADNWKKDAPSYTASLDDAMSLADDDPNEPLHEAVRRLSKKFHLHMRRWPDNENYVQWLARYACAAILRARGL